MTTICLRHLPDDLRAVLDAWCASPASHPVLGDWRRVGYRRGATPPRVGSPIVEAHAVGVRAGAAADVSARLQDALDDLAAAGGGVLQLNADRYVLDTPLFIHGSNVVLRGCRQGRDNAVLHAIVRGAGVKAPLVHYYFPTLDDLFIVAFRRRSERNLERLAAALQGDDPLQALWDLANDKTHVALTLEFLALGNHRKAFQAEMAEVAERFRKVELEAFTPVAAAAGIDLDEYPPDALLLIMMSIPTSVVLEESMGMSSGHEHAVLLVERYLSQLRGAPLRHTTTRKSPRKIAKRVTKKSTKKAAKRTTKTARKGA